MTTIEDLKIKRKKLMPCKSPPFLTSISTITINEPVFLQYHSKFVGKYGATSAECCFHVIARANDSDSEINLSSECTPFGNRFELSREWGHIYVKCTSKGKKIYSNIHAIITQKEEFFERQNRTDIINKNPYKVLMIGFDKMSRLNLQRGMPKIYSLLANSSDWFEVKGYNRIDNSSYSNLFAMLTGESPSKDCGSFLDGCNFIWKDYERAGYITAYAEDQMSRSSFNKWHKGFKSPPTDYYFRPFVVTSEKTLKFRKVDDLVFCLGQSLYIDHIFVYALKLFVIHENEPYFGFFYVNSLGSKRLSTSPFLDDRLSSAFLQNFEDGSDSNTILIYFGDSGTRFEQDFVS